MVFVGDKNKCVTNTVGVNIEYTFKYKMEWNADLIVFIF